MDEIENFLSLLAQSWLRNLSLFLNSFYLISFKNPFIGI